ncbi:HD domain-containing protein [Niallia endozanthoxylica]|uniref:HD domain-containing protein n=1 Tax=Niallia endozanthoxylica TaxID=2036016 RepID=A0A5J5HQ06_9BACI|nr:HD domain-containing protein [Niallia endozanthoxylica]KAA9023809.1 HD domain-containing protein [Niallia endozanthoxylica]
MYDSVKLTKEFVKQKLSGDSSGHDWWHIERVYANSLQIMHETTEAVQKEVIELAALLHDIADWKFHDGDETIGPKIVREWLESLQVDEEVITHVCQIVKDISFKGAKVQVAMKSLEGQIVQDADRLDALGAIGIARTFAYGGLRGRELYNPLIEPKIHETAEDYKSQQTTTINHFFEKLLLLRDRMNTPAAKNLANERHEYMVEFLENFFHESHQENSLHYKWLSKYR